MTDKSAAQEPVSDEVTLTLPPRPEYARIARLAVTGLAARMRFSYDDVEDLRVGVGEICNIVLEPGGGPLVVRCTLEDHEIRVSVSRSDITSALDVTDLSRQILEAFLSEVNVDPIGGRIDATKRRSTEP